MDLEEKGDLSSAISEALNGEAVDEGRKMTFLSQAFRWTKKGELYEDSPGNVENFYRSLRDYMFESGAVSRTEEKVRT